MKLTETVFWLEDSAAGQNKETSKDSCVWEKGSGKNHLRFYRTFFLKLNYRPKISFFYPQAEQSVSDNRFCQPSVVFQSRMSLGGEVRWNQ